MQLFEPMCESCVCSHCRGGVSCVFGGWFSWFLGRQLAGYIMNSCHKVLRLIRNTTLKLWGNCAKQFIRNARNFGKSKQAFCTAITHQLTHDSLCVSFYVIMPQPPYSPHLATADSFLFPKLKTPMKAKRFTMIEEINEKSKQELLAVSKSLFQKCLGDWIGRLLWRGQDSYW